MIPTQEDVNAYLDRLAHAGQDVLSLDREWLAYAYMMARVPWARGERGPGWTAVSSILPYIDEWKSRAQAPCC
jgi:hypothetical protein